MRNKRGLKVLSEEFVRILSAVLGITILVILLGYAIQNAFIEKSNVRKAQSELDELVKTLKLSYLDGQNREYSAVYAPRWYLFSSEFNDLCTGPFCLCLCKELDCSNPESRACKETDKFTVIKDMQNKEVRSIQIDKLPGKLGISINTEIAMPLTGQTQESGWFISTVSSPIFLKYEKDMWIWSKDLKNWSPANNKTIKNPKTPGEELEKENIDLLNILNTLDFEKGKTFLNQAGARYSDGFYLIKKLA